MFVIGATGFIGAHLIAELIGVGHRAVKLARTQAGAAAADAVVHAAFDPPNQGQSSEAARRAIAALGAALAGSDRPLVITSGTDLVGSRAGGPAL